MIPGPDGKKEKRGKRERKRAESELESGSEHESDATGNFVNTRSLNDKTAKLNESKKKAKKRKKKKKKRQKIPLEWKGREKPRFEVKRKAMDCASGSNRVSNKFGKNLRAHKPYF